MSLPGTLFAQHCHKDKQFLHTANAPRVAKTKIYFPAGICFPSSREWNVSVSRTANPYGRNVPRGVRPGRGIRLLLGYFLRGNRGL